MIREKLFIYTQTIFYKGETMCFCAFRVTKGETETETETYVNNREETRKG